MKSSRLGVGSLIRGRASYSLRTVSGDLRRFFASSLDGSSFTLRNAAIMFGRKKIKNSFIKAFRAGEEQAFDQLFREYYPALCLFATKLLHIEAAAEDIVQDCFVSLWDRRKKLDHIDDIKSYLYTTVRYRCISYSKLKNQIPLSETETEKDPADPNPNIENLVVLAETIREIHRLISLLPPRMQQVFRLYYLEGKSYQEISAILHTDPETVRNQRFKALQLIRKTIIPG